MDERQARPPVAVALEHMTGPSRGALTWLSASTLDVTQDANCLLQIEEAQAGTPPENMVARLHRHENTYELQAPEKGNVWVNGNRVTTAQLKNGDTVEFGETGPMCRIRFYSEHTPVRPSVPDILSDIYAYLKASRQPIAQRFFRAFCALFGRLTHESSLFFRLTLLAAIVGFGILAYQQYRLNERLQQDIDSAAMRLASISADVVNARKEALRPSDLAELRDSLQQRVTSNLSRLEELELRSTATARVIAGSVDSVAFIIGSYGYREIDGERMLRHAVSAGGMPLMSPRGRPLLSLDGTGPVAEVQFTGTGFFLGNSDVLVTNRHVALPWEQGSGGQGNSPQGVEPVMQDFVAYLPGSDKSLPLHLLRASETADVALLQAPGAANVAGLDLSEALPAPGDEVIVMGYPTGLRSMLAQSGADFIADLQASGEFDFWTIAARLAAENHIQPLASRGIVGQVTAAATVYDAETTHGGSGGPVLNVNGEVVAVNAAILPEFGGSNIGVPVKEVRSLMADAELN